MIGWYHFFKHQITITYSFLTADDIFIGENINHTSREKKKLYTKSLFQLTARYLLVLLIERLRAIALRSELPWLSTKNATVSEFCCKWTPPSEAQKFTERIKQVCLDPEKFLLLLLLLFFRADTPAPLPRARTVGCRQCWFFKYFLSMCNF